MTSFLFVFFCTKRDRPGGFENCVYDFPFTKRGKPLALLLLGVVVLLRSSLLKKKKKLKKSAFRRSVLKRVPFFNCAVEKRDRGGNSSRAHFKVRTENE